MVGLRQGIKECSIRTQVGILRRILRGRHVWSVLDRLGIPGFGTHLVRYFYPVEIQNDTSVSYSKISELFEEQLPKFEETLARLVPYFAHLQEWPLADDPKRPLVPHCSSGFMSIGDGGLLYSLLQHLRPKRFLEIGSGMSTRIAHEARGTGGFEMEITSVDPNPRLSIDQICDSVLRKPFESVSSSELPRLSAGDVLFFDGSHYVYPGNDVVHFFFDVLPQLPRNIYVHIHDIFLPYDYQGEYRQHMWAEQYLLGTWLIGGSKGIEVVFPGCFMSQKESFQKVVNGVYEDWEKRYGDASQVSTFGTSFWLKTV